MRRTWQIRRETIEQPDGQIRWDHAYQLLLRWTATAAPGWTAPAWTRFVTTRPGPPSTWCWSPRRTGWPATTCTRWWSWRNWSAAACGWCSSIGPPAMTRCAAGDPDSWCGGRIRADPDRRPHAPRPAGQAAQRTAAALDAGALRLPAAPRTAPGPGPGPDRPGRRRGRAGVIRRLRGRRVTLHTLAAQLTRRRVP